MRILKGSGKFVILECAMMKFAAIITPALGMILEKFTLIRWEGFAQRKDVLA